MLWAKTASKHFLQYCPWCLKVSSQHTKTRCTVKSECTYFLLGDCYTQSVYFWHFYLEFVIHVIHTWFVCNFMKLISKRQESRGQHEVKNNKSILYPYVPWQRFRGGIALFFIFFLRNDKLYAGYSCQHCTTNEVNPFFCSPHKRDPITVFYRLSICMS